MPPLLNAVVTVLQTTKTAQPFWDAITSGYEGPVYSPEQWDRVTIGGIVIPGICDVKSGSVEKRIDVQKPHGRDGGALIERGLVPGKFDIDVLLWTPEQWEEWCRIRPVLYRRAGKIDINDKKKSASQADIELTEKAAFTIEHPGLNSLDITRAIIARITIPVPGSEVGTRSFTISCVEYLPPGKAVASRKLKGTAPVKRDPGFTITPKVNEPHPPSANEGGPHGPPPAPSHGSH